MAKQKLFFCGASSKFYSGLMAARLSAKKLSVLITAWLLIVLASQQVVANDTQLNKSRDRSSIPTGVIFDTDMWIDIDDMMALAMLHALQDRGELELLAVTLTTEDQWIGPYVALINSFYGHGDIPVGTVRGGVTPALTIDTIKAIYPFLDFQKINYTQALAQAKTETGQWVYPRQLMPGTALPEAVSLLRKTLAARPDDSVVIVQAGYSTNMAKLLDSEADAISPLDGRTLISNKVRLLSTMAGDFSQEEQGSALASKSQPEFNMLLDVSSAQTLFKRWPTPIVVSGKEVGEAMVFPAQSIVEDFSYIDNHPIAQSYRYYELGASRWPHDHYTYDPTAVLYAARPNRNYFSLSPPGTVVIDDAGSSMFQAHEGGSHRHLKVNKAQQARSLEAMIMLISQPPISSN